MPPTWRDLQILGCFVTDDINIVIKGSLSTSNHCYHTWSPILKSRAASHNTKLRIYHMGYMPTSHVCNRNLVSWYKTNMLAVWDRKILRKIFEPMMENKELTPHLETYVRTMKPCPGN